MKEEIFIGVSNRHVHLNEEVYKMLFDEPLEVEKELTQPGQFASKQKVTLIANDYEIEGVRILGPLRDYCQVEISHNDALKFKLNPPVRASGDIQNSEVITLKNGDKQVTIYGCIISQRHLHISPEDAQKRNLVNGQKVLLSVTGEKGGIMECYVKISDNSPMEIHIDTDDANAFLIGNDNNNGILIF